MDVQIFHEYRRDNWRIIGPRKCLETACHCAVWIKKKKKKGTSDENGDGEMSVRVSNDTFIHLTLNKLKMDFYRNMCGHNARQGHITTVVSAIWDKQIYI